MTPTLGPDATGVGWVYQYAVVAKEMTLAELRSLQDWVVRYAASKAEGVAEVASVGGFVKQYNVVVDPRRLRAQGISLAKLRDAIRASNMDVGGRTVELSEFEFMVRGRGYLKSIEDIENIVLKTEAGSAAAGSGRRPGRARTGRAARHHRDERRRRGRERHRPAAVRRQRPQRHRERQGEARGDRLEPAEGRRDRAGLRPLAADQRRPSRRCKSTLVEESIIVALVCIVFLLHVRSALVAILMLPVGILMAFAAMKLMGLGSNIMSLGGIAIAVGAMIDAAIVMIENAHKHLERAPPGKPRVEILIEAASEVGPALFFSLLIITVSFLPIFTLESQEGRLFGPLAFTKTFAMAAAALLSVTLVPALMVIFVRGRIIPEHRNPLNRLLIWLYRPVIRGVLKAQDPHDPARAASRSRPPSGRRANSDRSSCRSSNEGTLMYMPTTLPGLSVTKAAELLADAGPDHQVLSGGRIGLRQGRAGVDRDRSGADRDVRDHHQPEAEVRVAARRDAREPQGRDGQGAPVPRRLERLDDADPGPHRHALDRHPHARSASRCSAPTSPRWRRSPARSRRWSARCPARRAPTPSG